MGKTYTLSQILFGLRNEYLEVERQLAELNKYLLPGANIEGAEFHIVGNPCKLDLYLHKRKTLLDKIEMLLGVYVHGMNTFDATSGVSRRYYLGNKMSCYILDPEKVNEQIVDIVGSNFFNNIVANNYTAIPFVQNDSFTSLVAKDKSLLVAPYGIDVINGYSVNNECFSYNAHNDDISINAGKRLVDSYDILDMLGMQIDGDYLREYHRDVIDNQEEKEIFVSAFCRQDGVKLQIVEEPKRYVLRPKASR